MEPIDAVFFFGTGTVVHAWEPVLRALTKKYGTSLGKDALGQDLATRWLGLHGINNPCRALDRDLANWVFGVRVSSARYAASLRSLQRTDPKVKRADDDMRAELLDLKATIASELHEAQESGETHIREATVEAAAVDAGDCRSAILTANWDLNLERWIKSAGEEPKVLHVHGSIERPSTMLLPGEVLNEPHRDGADNKYLKNTYVDAMGHFAYAKRVYVVGLGLSPSDAALGAALGEGLQVWTRNAGKEAFGEVVVVNLQKDMERITGQVRMLIPDRWKVRPLAPPG
jgi:hypothetical protein